MTDYGRLTVPVLRELCKAHGITECNTSSYLLKTELIDLLNQHNRKAADYNQMKRDDLEMICANRGISECATSRDRRALQKRDLVDLLNRDNTGDSSRKMMVGVSPPTDVIPYGDYDNSTYDTLRDLCRLRELEGCGGTSRRVPKQLLIDRLKRADKQEGPIDYSALNVDILREICRRRNIPGCGKGRGITKYELIKMLRDADNSTPYYKTSTITYNISSTPSILPGQSASSDTLSKSRVRSIVPTQQSALSVVEPKEVIVVES